MTSDNNDILLLVKGQSPQANLDALLDDLKPLKILDLYTLRMRLTGQAVNMLHKGSRDELAPLAAILSRHQITNWMVAQREPVELGSPDTIHRTAQGLVFTQDGHEHLLSKNSEPLIVLVDITAQVVERIIKRSQVQYAYTGGVHTDQNHDDLRREIFRQQPRIALAWGGTPQQPDHLLYLSAWDIPPEILGDKARPSRKWNLFEFLEVVCHLCPKHHFDTNFGIGFLPDYRVFPCDAADHSGINKNLATLARYTTLLLDMAQDNLQRQHTTAGAAQQATNTVISLATAFQLSGVSPGQSQQKPPTPQKAPRPSLPAPPSPRMLTGLSLHFNGWRLLANLGAVALFFFVEVNHKAAGSFYHYGFSTGLAPLGVSGLCLWNALFFWRLRQHIKNTATSKARSAAMGMVELYGKAKRQYALVSPNTLQPCVYYSLKRYRRTHKDHWRLTSITTSDTVPFILEDDTGRISVNPHGATFRLKNSHSSSDLTSANEKWVEEVIYENSMVYVLGFASTAHKHQSSLGQRVAEKLRELKGNREQMMTYDRDSDGHVSSAEWDEARSDMEQQALHEKLQQGQDRSNEQLVLSAPPQKDLPFIIAETESEASLVSHYSWQVPLLLIAGLAAFAWAIKAGVTYFHLI